MPTTSLNQRWLSEVETRFLGVCLNLFVDMIQTIQIHLHP